MGEPIWRRFAPLPEDPRPVVEPCHASQVASPSCPPAVGGARSRFLSRGPRRVRRRARHRHRALAARGDERAGAGAGGSWLDSFIVYYRNDAPPGDTHGAAAKRVRRHVNANLGRIGKAFGLDVRHSRRMDTGGHVIRLGQRKLDAAEADRFIRAFADDSQVLSIEPNIRLHLTTLPNDTCWDSSGD